MSNATELAARFGIELGATGQVAVNATPAEVFRVVSDPVAMARFAEETYDVRWLDGATESAVGARFLGFNRNGWHRWQTRCRITELETDRRFAYEVAFFTVRVSRWQYDIEPAANGCVVTETSSILAPLWFAPFGLILSGVANRPGANKVHISTTLDRLRSHIEANR